MWSLYLFMNKLLKLEEERGNRSHEDEPTLSDSCLYSSPSNDGISPGIMLPHSHFIEVPHVNQLCNWDCGLACILMVLRTIGIDNCDLQTLEKLCGTKRISCHMTWCV
uniref:Guanylate cyclase n=1 Tax=Opuntia streptacantha TaxID=393608 RepID=A0A7C8YRE2_OPUST